MEALANDVIALRIFLAERREVSYLLSLDSDRWVLRHPLPVTLQRSDEVWTASAEDFDAYGDGEERSDALDSLRNRLVDDMDELTTSEPELGPHLARLLSRLRTHISPAAQ